MKTPHPGRYCCFIAASAHLFAALAIMSASMAWAALPSGYTQYTYIKGNGSGAKVVVTDTLEITSSPDDIGSPSPAYGVTNGLAAGASFTVSCGATPVTNTAGTRQYFCAGWKLYDRNGEVVSKGVDDSFSYTHPSPAEYRRLEWQWLYDGGAHDKMTVAVIETRPCDVAEGIVTLEKLGFLLIVR